MDKQTAGPLNKSTVRKLQPGEWARGPLGARGAGTLEARALKNGTVTYYLRVTTTGRQERISIGALPYPDAMKRATELSLRYQSGERDLAAALKSEQVASECQIADEEAEQQRTLGALLTAYGNQLAHDGKPSAREVQKSLERHVAKAWPMLWDTRVDEITISDLIKVVSKPASKGHARAADQLRAYLRSAFTSAIHAQQDASAIPELRALRISTNPAANLAPVKGSRNARDRVLSVAELKAYWKHIESRPGIDGALLRFHLLTGGQRIVQLARATLSDDYDSDTQTLRLWDFKGRPRDKPREHLVPLTPAALDAMRVMHGDPYVFTVTAGQTGATRFVMRDHLKPVIDAMQDADELERGRFTAGDIRRTVETRLSAAKVGHMIRAHLQSHGLGGVQSRHYDKHDYLDEKRAALETLQRIATGASPEDASMSKV